MREEDFLKYYGYTLQDLDVINFLSEDFERLFEEIFISAEMTNYNKTQKEAENEYSWYISRKIVRRYY